MFLQGEVRESAKLDQDFLPEGGHCASFLEACQGMFRHKVEAPGKRHRADVKRVKTLLMTQLSRRLGR